MRSWTCLNQSGSTVGELRASEEEERLIPPVLMPCPQKRQAKKMGSELPIAPLEQTGSGEWKSDASISTCETRRKDGSLPQQGSKYCFPWPTLEGVGPKCEM